MKRPKKLDAGDTIGIAAPASWFDPDKFMIAVGNLQNAGFKVKFDDGIFARERYFAGSLERRAKELQNLLCDESISAVMFARGGYGTQHVLPLLDAEAISDVKPKMVIGYSDLTVLHSWLRDQCNWVTCYGPTLCGHLSDTHAATNVQLLLQACFAGTIKIPSEKLRIIKPGKSDSVVNGDLAGGCLSLVHASVGTDYEWRSTDETIWFFEDRGEKIYALDRMLMHLKHAGYFEEARAVLFGSLELSANETKPDELDEMLQDVFHDFNGPVIAGIPAGHCDPFTPLPFGSGISVDIANNEIRLFEPWIK